MSNEEDREVKQREAGNRETARLWRAWRTVHELVQDRGYILSEAEVKISLEDFIHKFNSGDGNIEKNRMTFTAHPSDEMVARYSNPVTDRDPKPAAPDVGPIKVKFEEGDSIGIKNMRKFAQELTQESFHTGIMITSVNITPAALKIIPAVASETRIETFLEADLLVNITHHELVPKHVLLSKEEKSALLQRYRLKETQLPRIQVGDPVARYLGLRRGQVVKIIRKSETAGRYASYRYTV
ncbi:DNA-directed RNA polymerases I,II,and III subunit [Lachnellula hyalina]|uniref:DNA-directed RNA polymerases I, II, and III subunit RPABC1 n=1 Tax=Lachnellula hyalina TaxID=1316788 RepID=A0A8H8TWH2_9HELO|nr:DNA-directed RNA polymerases I,II,and III subunit [Lachnellula hyalina]TVY24894.1 DNA-directed RNA polymerases I,II,and III subunit [Lachnellula hyalina]